MEIVTETMLSNIAASECTSCEHTHVHAAANATQPGTFATIPFG